jgi:hypothetical protein
MGLELCLAFWSVRGRRYSVSGELGVKRLGCDQIDRMANPSVISAMPKIIRILQLLNS